MFVYNAYYFSLYTNQNYYLRFNYLKKYSTEEFFTSNCVTRWENRNIKIVPRAYKCLKNFVLKTFLFCWKCINWEAVQLNSNERGDCVANKHDGVRVGK